MKAADELLSLALELPQPQRAALAHQLLISLNEGEYESDSEAAWAAEIEARLAKVEQGQFTARDWREALADIRQSLAAGSANRR